MRPFQNKHLAARQFIRRLIRSEDGEGEIRSQGLHVLKQKEGEGAKEKYLQ